MYRILVVEDEEALRLLICDLLTLEGYEVDGAANGRFGLEMLQKKKYDLVISDIHMPEMGGFEFFEQVQIEWPEMHRVLMTAYNVDDFLELISTHKVGNTIAKGNPFDASELLLTVKQLLTRNIFGLEKHMADGTHIDRNLISKPGQIDELCHALALVYGSENNFQKLRTVFVELATNAVFYGARGHSAKDRDTWNRDFELSPEETIEVYHARDREKLGIAIVDNGGKLDQETILYWLNRQISPGNEGLPQGVFDSHGRGLFITRKYADRLIINVERGKRCESVILNYYNGAPSQFKPVRINEI